MKTLEEIVMDKFAIGDGCWEWIASRDSKGYGQINRRGKSLRAHRVVYEWLVGPIPEGLDLDHLCRNRGCVRPDHLEPVTRRENLRRSPVGGPAFQRSKTHCARGHEFSEANTYLNRGWRLCRRCRTLAMRDPRARGVSV